MLTNDQKTLIENKLCYALRVFHDLDDKERRNAMSKDFFWKFCQENNLDPKEVFEIIEKDLKDPSKRSFSNYQDSIEAIRE